MDNILNYAYSYGPKEMEYREKITKLNIEKTKLYMELRDLKNSLDIITYRKREICIFFVTGMAIFAVLFCVSVFLWLRSFSMYDVYGERLHIASKYVILVSVIAFIIMAIPYFCMMSQKYFWIECANFLRFEKIEMQRNTYIREIREIYKKCAEIDEEVSELMKKISLLKEEQKICFRGNT